MIPQVPGKIYLADQRGLLETSQFRRQSTFSFETFQHEYKGPLGRLYGLNEETLAGGHTVEFAVAADSYIVLLPITGAVAFSMGGGPHGTVEAEEIATIAAPAGTTLALRNVFADELSSFLHIWVRATKPLAVPHSATAMATVFDGPMLENQLRELVSARIEDHPPIEPNLPFVLSLGRFLGRHEAVYHLTPGSRLFAFIIAGAFELEGRLLHEKDGLALWNVAEVELEALSNHALVLVLELLPD
jgi:redox-sensitive bicupin YhaK (pirin superfamily)